MRCLWLLFFILSNYSFASNCEYSIGTTKIMWTAFKTPKKVGVKGEFNRHSLNTNKSTSSLGLIKGARFNIDTTSVDTGNPGRDKTIAEYFFQSKSKPLQISGSVIETNLKTTRVLFDINGKKKEILLKNKIEESKIILNGSIDVIELGLNENLSAIHKACEKLHEGKTWSDVNIAIEAVVEKKCR
jgi:hypothetical protein